MLRAINPSQGRAGTLFDLLRLQPDDAGGVSAVLGRDPTLGARVLGVTNSAAFGIAQRVASVQRAVVLLGPARARSVALAHGLRSMTGHAGLPNSLADALWAAGIAKACAAHIFCRVVDQAQADEAYAVGLVQDIALPAMMSLDRDFYEQLVDRDDPGDWCAAERERFGIDHADVGAAMLSEWGAPESLADAVRQHHRLPEDDDEGELCASLRLAAFTAGLLPHWREPVNSRTGSWLEAIHARLLADHIASPDAFVRQATVEGRTLCGMETTLEDADRADLMDRAIGVVSGDAVRATMNLCRLEAVLERERADFQQMRARALTDALTRVLNRRGFMTMATRELRWAGGSETSVTCMIADIDDFKSINDRLGHRAGDRVLRGLARLLRRTCARYGVVGRIGGDEFAVLIGGLSEEQARRLANDLIEQAQSVRVRIPSGAPVELRFSLGAVFHHHASDRLLAEELLAQADRAMYRSKREGKNRGSFTAEEPPHA